MNDLFREVTKMVRLGIGIAAKAKTDAMDAMERAPGE